MGRRCYHDEKHAKECKGLLEAGKGMGKDSPLEPPEGTGPCLNVDLRTVRPI